MQPSSPGERTAQMVRVGMSTKSAARQIYCLSATGSHIATKTQYLLEATSSGPLFSHLSCKQYEDGGSPCLSPKTDSKPPQKRFC